jgi:hypothetical protein
VGEATKVATPTFNKIVNFLSTSSPETLGKVALAAVAIYFLTPIVIKLFFSSLRGYAGMQSRRLSPASLLHDVPPIVAWKVGPGLDSACAPKHVKQFSCFKSNSDETRQISGRGRFLCLQ